MVAHALQLRHSAAAATAAAAAPGRSLVRSWRQSSYRSISSSCRVADNAAQSRTPPFSTNAGPSASKCGRLHRASSAAAATTIATGAISPRGATQGQQQHGPSLGRPSQPGQAVTSSRLPPSGARAALSLAGQTASFPSYHRNCRCHCAEPLAVTLVRLGTRSRTPSTHSSPLMAAGSGTDAAKRRGSGRRGGGGGGRGGGWEREAGAAGSLQTEAPVEASALLTPSADVDLQEERSHAGDVVVVVRKLLVRVGAEGLMTELLLASFSEGGNACDGGSSGSRQAQAPERGMAGAGFEVETAARAAAEAAEGMESKSLQASHSGSDTSAGKSPPRVNVLVVPGNPGVVDYYVDYLRELCLCLGPERTGTVVCVCHVAHTQEDWEKGRVFSLQQQVQHKVDFLAGVEPLLRRAVPASVDAAAAAADAKLSREGRGGNGAAAAAAPTAVARERSDGGLRVDSRVGNGGLTANGAAREAGEQQQWVLVGHSIGAHICMEVHKQLPHLVTQVVGMYPFLSLNLASREQRLLGLLAHATPLCVAVAALVQALRRLLPPGALRKVVRRGVHPQWSVAAVEATQRSLLQYSVLRNYAYMGMTEFDYFGSPAGQIDWEWLRQHQKQTTFLFGLCDHWGPISLHDEMRARLPAMRVLLDNEGHCHAFCCTDAGSRSIALRTAAIITESAAAALTLKTESASTAKAVDMNSA